MEPVRARVRICVRTCGEKKTREYRFTSLLKAQIENMIDINTKDAEAEGAEAVEVTEAAGAALESIACASLVNPTQKLFPFLNLSH